MRTGVRKRAVAAMAAAAVAVGSWALALPGTARADSAPTPVTATNPTTVTADALPTVQINGVVWSQVVVGDTVYVGGSFTRARPAGAAAGTNETVRNNLLAFDIRTGQLITSFAPNLNAQARALAASPDGTRLYVGGDFTVADGQPRQRIAAYDTRTGALVDGFKPSVNGEVAAVAATNTTVYFGGGLSAVGGVSRTRLAAVRAADGGLLPWAPVPGAGPTSGNRLPFFDAAGKPIPGTLDAGRNNQTSIDVTSLVVTGGGAQVVVGGRFYSMNGALATAIAALDPVSAANRPFAFNQIITNQGVNSAVWSLSTDGTTVYGTGYDYYGPGNLEGSFAVTANGGQVKMIGDCRGDTYSSYAMGDALYLASHAHQCINIGGYPEQDPQVWKFATALSTAANGRVGTITQANANFAGQPAPQLLNWFPTFTQGSFTGQYQAGWSVTGNGQYVVYGGEFPRVNGQGQQGLVRFAVPSMAPNAMGPSVTPGVSVTPTSGGLRVGWQGSTDQDNRVLTYRVFRDNGAQPVATFTRSSLWWQVAPVAWTDRTAAAGSHTYRVTVSDPFGNEVAIGTGTGTSSGTTATRPYAAAVQADGATDHWSLGERSGTTSSDLDGVDDLVGSGGLARGIAGALRGDTDTSTWFDGVGGYFSTQTPRQGLHTFSVEAWFETRSTAGGKILGFGDQRTGLSNNHDRQVWLEPSGKLHFAVFPGFGAELVTPTALNNGQWHHVVASVGASGMSLYVDGKLVASRTDVIMAQYITGYWRIGGDRTWSGAPYFNGLIDEVAVYPTVLSADQVARHYAVGTTGTGANLAPEASFTSSAQDLTASFDGTLSVDPDGAAIAGYRWDFGDGTTGTGVTATHAYAAGGTYTVRLTVTDAAGATGTAQRQVIVAAPPNKAPTAAFTATATDLSVAVDGRGSSDADGTLASYRWTWGDGTAAGTGATATHAFAAAGVYQVTLTVTDDDGATGSVTRGVAVAAAGATPPIVTDAFDRSTTGGLGTAPLGGLWTASVGAARQSVSGGAAVLTLPSAGLETIAHLGGVSVTSADVRTAFTPSSVPTGSGTYAYVTGRRVGSGEEYTVRVRVAPDGSVYLALSRVTGGVETFPGGEVLVPGLTWRSGTTLATRVQVAGTGTTTITASVWVAGQAEPATPQLSRTDTTAALQKPGSVGIGAYRPANATAATSVAFADLAVTAVGATPTPPPANVAPTAAFTAQATGLAVAVDGRTSADSDGTVAGYSWNWGDGTAAGSGATASHTYATAGSYTVTLTVTDDDGATATATRPVTLTAPGGPAQPLVLAADAFERAVTAGLGNADVGGAWTASVGASRLSVASGGAVLSLPTAGNETGAYLGSVAATAVDVRAAVSLSSAPTGTGTFVEIGGRRVGAGNEYTVRMRVAPDGGVFLALSRIVAGTETFPGGETQVAGLTWTPGSVLQVRVRVTGTGTTTVTGAVWATGGTEPVTPQLSRTDTTAALQAPGTVGIGAYRPGSATAATAVRFDDLQVTVAQ
ncbi:PKD domain-containing protein [Blastococcus sp. URHD0036]|uniref:PKD domain-containing protein n=1 Tax=Blastococcus sp. URHD0036 TaxID=1380356 RepID=UPI001E4246AA|nr:PKD domain-containing protein [Blastococcus sp. URHD0036]